MNQTFKRYTLKEILDLGPQKPSCSCCNQQFCDRHFREYFKTEPFPEYWDECIKSYKCVHCGVRKNSAFWLRTDGMECDTCR